MTIHLFMVKMLSGKTHMFNKRLYRKDNFLYIK